jgi:hypothetical protein
MYPTQQKQRKQAYNVAFPSTLQSLSMVPQGATVSLLVRHAEREPIRNPEMAFVAGLTPQGIADSQQFGEYLLGKFQPGAFYSSPVGRCVQTAEGILQGAAWQKQVLLDDRLTHTFIRAALDALSISRNSLGVPDQVIQLFSLLCGAKGETITNRLNFFVTHDTVITTMLGYLLGLPDEDIRAPDFLEGFLLWRQGKLYNVVWRGQRFVFKLSRVLGL